MTIPTLLSPSSINLAISPIHILFLLLGTWFLHRLLKWHLQLRLLRKSMPGIPVVAVLFQPWSLLRRLFPKKWQTYHSGWQFQGRRSFEYRSGRRGTAADMTGHAADIAGDTTRDMTGDIAGDNEDGDLLTLVPLFGDPVVFCFDARGIEEIATSPGRFPKNLSMYSTSSLSLFCSRWFASGLSMLFMLWFMLLFILVVRV